MSNFNHAYSRHTAEELEAARAPARAPAREATLLAFNIERVAATKTTLYARIANIQTSCLELVELVDEIHSGEQRSRDADLKSLNERLRVAENELFAATDRLADELGMTAM
jgi:hypothetical protein